MSAFAGVRVCLRVVSDLHNTAAPSPGKVTPKTKGGPELLRQERGAQSHPTQLMQQETEQGNRQGPGKVAQPQPLQQNPTHTQQQPSPEPPLRHPCCSWPQGKPYCQKSKVREGNRARAGHNFSGCAFPACSPSGFLYLPDCLALLYHYHLLSPFLWLACPIYLRYPSLGMTPVDTPFPFSPSHPPTGCQFPCSHLRLFPFAGD